MSPTGGYAALILLNGTAPPQDHLLLARTLVCRAPEDRRKGSTQGGSSRCGWPRRGRSVQPGRALPLCRQLRRQRHRHPQARWRQAHEGRQLCLAGTSGLDAGEYALRCGSSSTHRRIARLTSLLPRDKPLLSFGARCEVDLRLLTKEAACGRQRSKSDRGTRWARVLDAMVG